MGRREAASHARDVRALQRQDLAAHGGAPARGDPLQGERNDGPDLTVSPQAYPALLARVYKAAKFPKPRNALGFEKDLPADEMEKLLLANHQVADAGLAELGRRRAQSIQDWLVAHGPLGAARIFIVDTPLAVHAEGPDVAANTAHLSRADFSLR
jgi:hypothetical protein